LEPSVRFIFKGGPDRGFQNVAKQSDAGEIPKRRLQYSKHGESLKSRSETCYKKKFKGRFSAGYVGI
jgi:hypothetical protein